MNITAALSELVLNCMGTLVRTGMGALHPDHQLVRDALLSEAIGGRQTPLYLYEDVPARVQHPIDYSSSGGLRSPWMQAKVGIHRHWDGASKLDALMCYRSQLYPFRNSPIMNC